MKNTHLISCSFLLIFFISCATKNQKNSIDRNGLINKNFPELKAETLSKKEIVFPKDVSGKPTIFIIAFKGDAQKLVDTWTKQVLEKYANKEVNFYEIPMISGGYKIMRSVIDGGMRGGVPENLHDNVATYYGKLDDFKTNLLMFDNNNIYVYLLDKLGKIKFITEGFSTEKKLIELDIVIEKLK